MLLGCLALARERLAGHRTDKKEQVPSVLLPASLLLEPPKSSLATFVSGPLSCILPPPPPTLWVAVPEFCRMLYDKQKVY